MRNEKGFTLIELIVTFALITIFMGSAVATVTSFTQVYTRISSIGRLQTVSDMVAQTIVSEVGSAEKRTSGFSVEITTPVSPDFSEVSFSNENSIPLTIRVDENGYLKLDYKAVKDSGGREVSKAVDWYYGANNYMGSSITKMLLERDADDNNLLKLTLVLVHEQTGKTLTTEKVFPCYNLEMSDISAVST